MTPEAIEPLLSIIVLPAISILLWLGIALMLLCFYLNKKEKSNDETNKTNNP